MNASSSLNGTKRLIKRRKLDEYLDKGILDLMQFKN